MEREEADEQPETRTAPANARYPLAFDAMGNPIKVPAEATAWRVRRGGGRRGRPRQMFDTETGRQLEIPLGATVDELVEAGCPPDRYLLYPVDGSGNVISGVIAVTEVPEEAGNEEPPQTVQAVEQSALLAVIREQQQTIRQNAEALQRALDSTASGYGPLKRHDLPEPVVLERPSPPAEQPQPSGNGGFSPEAMGQIMGVVKLVFDAFQGMMQARAAAPTAQP